LAAMTREELRPYLKDDVDPETITAEQAAMVEEFIERCLAKLLERRRPFCDD